MLICFPLLCVYCRRLSLRFFLSKPPNCRVVQMPETVPASFYRKVKEAGPRLRELSPAARGGQEESITQPRAHLLDHPCMSRDSSVDRSISTPSPLSISVVFFPLLLLPHLVLICLVILGKRGSRSPYRRRAIGIGGGRVTFRSSGHETSFKETCHRLQ